MTSRYRHPRKFPTTTANLIRAQELRAMLYDDAEEIRVKAEKLAAKLRLLSRPSSATLVDVDLTAARDHLRATLDCIEKLLASRPRVLEAAE